MKLLLAGYRSWALDTMSLIKIDHAKNHTVECAFFQPQLESLMNREEWDAVILLGWSWIVPDDLLSKSYVACFHPSDLPMFRGGSPIQHQIMSGIVNTKATLFKITPGSEIDAGPIISKTDINLDGQMSDIFVSLTRASFELVDKFITSWPNIHEEPQDLSKGCVRKRLPPEHSRLVPKDFATMSVKELYDFIRSKDVPYPRAYIEDETGKLYFTAPVFEDK